MACFSLWNGMYSNEKKWQASDENFVVSDSGESFRTKDSEIDHLGSGLGML